MAFENFGFGTLIIPMDTTYQNNDVFKAYGLIYELLSKGIPVKWAIQPEKPFDGTDFIATAQDIQTLAPIINHNYSGGPFIIDFAYYDDALVIITGWQSLYPVAVHSATAPFTADIASTMIRAPRIAVPTYNRNIMTDYLNLAAIPDSNGDPWPGGSSDILTGPNIDDGALFGYDKSECRRIYYDIFLSPPAASGTWNNPIRANELSEYLRLGGYLHAVDDSIASIEKEAGPFLTTNGISDTDTDKGDTGTFKVDIPDFPVDQSVSTGLPQGLPGGNFETWNHLTSGLAYNSETQILAHFMDDGKQYDFMIAGPYKNGTGAGKIVYEGGRNYEPEEPYTSNMENLYTRFVLNSIFFSISKPLLQLERSPEILFAGINNRITFTIVNTGGSSAPNTGFSVTLAPGVNYNEDATITTTDIVGQTLTWSSAALGTVKPGTVLTFTADFIPPAPVATKLADFSTSFDDEFDESYSLDSCLASEVEEFETANLNARKEVSKEYYINAGEELTYYVTIENNGTLPAENVVFYDRIPGGTIFNNNVRVRYDFGPFIPIPGADPGAGIDLNDIPQGGSAEVSFKVLVGNNEPPINIDNSATVDYQYTNLAGIFRAYSNSNTVRTRPLIIQLEAVKSVDKSAAFVGDTLTYTVVINNTGNIRGRNVIFRDNPPNGTTFVPDSVTIQIPYEPAIPLPGADPGAPGGIPLPRDSIIVTFKVKVDSIPVPNPIVNVATIDADFWPDHEHRPIHKKIDTNFVEAIIRTSLFIGFKQFSLQENVCLPEAKLDIEEISKVTAEVVIISTRVIKTPSAQSPEGQILTGFKLIVEGEVRQKIEYVADEPTQSVHAAHFNMPFSTFIILPEGYVLGTPVVVRGYIEDIYAKQIDKRCIFKNITIFVAAQ